MKRKFILPILGVLAFGTLTSSCIPPVPEQKETEKVSIVVVNGSGTGSYEKGKQVTITAIEQSGKTFVNWTKDGNIVSVSMTYTFTATEDATYVANYVDQVDTNSINIVVQNGSGSGKYEKGSTVTIVAEVPSGKVFVGWAYNGNIVSTDVSYTFTANESGTYVAIFINDDIPTSVTITVEGGSGSGNYNIGENVTIKTTPVQGKTFLGWMLNGNVVSNNLTYTFIASVDATYTAVFVNDSLETYEKVLTKKSGKDFKILNFSDVQLHDGEDYSVTEHVIDTLVTREEPDLIVFLGDLLNDDRTYKSIVNAQKFIEQVDSYNIPWAPIFGNHDNEDYQTGYASAKTTTSAQLAEWYDQAENCIFTYGPAYVPGKSNYFVTVKDEVTQKPVQTLIFLDSRLSGLSDEHDSFYRDIISYSTSKNNDQVVPSTLFTHIALNQYGDEYAKARECDYANIVGSINRDPCDLASGTKKLFPSMKELDSTDMVVCGHDHENAYYTVNDGITLAYSMKSSQGDKYTNFAEIGGSVVTISDEGKNLRYTKVLDIPMSLTKEKGDYPVFPDTLPNWRFSGAKLCFDIEVPESAGKLQFNIQGTNKYKPNQDEKTRLGAWNRLTKNVDITGGANASADYGSLDKIEGNKYSYKLDLTKLDLNASGGEEAYGSETARLIYFHDVNDNFKITNLRYDFENITETDQIDLANALVEPLEDQFTNAGLPVRPTPKVTLSGQNLKFADDFYVVFENNFEVGTAKGTILPSGKGAHKYKGSKDFTFKLVENPDDDKKPGHENAIQVDDTYTFEGNNFIGDAGIKDWYNGDKILQFDVKPLVYGKVKPIAGEPQTTRFALFGRNENLPASEVNNWNRFTQYYHIDFVTKSIHKTDSTSEEKTICHFEDISDGWYRVNMPLNRFELNDGALGNEKETIKLIYMEYIKRSFKITNFKVIGGEQPAEKPTEFKMDDDEFVVTNFTDVHITDKEMISETGTAGKTIKYGIEHSKPDIMLFSGDVAGNIEQLGYLLDYLDGFKIPYFLIQGNHDHQFLNYNSMELRVAESKYGYIKKGPAELGSDANYTIKIKNSSKELVHGLIMMDTGNKHSPIDSSLVEYVANPISGVKYGSYMGKTTYCDSQGWDGLHGKQIDWYESTVRDLGCETSLICHIPPQEFVKAYEKYQDAKNKGDNVALAACAPIGQCNMGEQCCGSIEQYGLFDKVKELGSTKNIICGHDHENDFSLLYEGVRLTYSLKTGEGAYWIKDGSRCGYTELKINSQGKTSLDQIYFNPLA